MNARNGSVRMTVASLVAGLVLAASAHAQLRIPDADNNRPAVWTGHWKGKGTLNGKELQADFALGEQGVFEFRGTIEGRTFQTKGKFEIAGDKLTTVAADGTRCESRVRRLDADRFECTADGMQMLYTRVAAAPAPAPRQEPREGDGGGPAPVRKLRSLVGTWTGTAMSTVKIDYRYSFFADGTFRSTMTCVYGTVQDSGKWTLDENNRLTLESIATGFVSISAISWNQHDDNFEASDGFNRVPFRKVN